MIIRREIKLFCFYCRDKHSLYSSVTDFFLLQPFPDLLVPFLNIIVGEEEQGPPLAVQSIHLHRLCYCYTEE